MLSHRKRDGMRRGILSIVLVAFALVLLSGSFFAAAAAPGPQNVTIAYSNNAIQLSWDAVANATQYNIYRGLSSGNETLYANTTNTTFVDSNVSAGHTYYYYVTAIVADNETNASQEVSFTIQASNGGNGGAGNVQIAGNAFNTWLLFVGIVLLSVGVPLYTYGAVRHRDVGKYATILGGIIVLVSYIAARMGYTFPNIVLSSVTLNGWLAIFGIIFIVLGIIVLLLTSERGKTAREFKGHIDAARFSIGFGVMMLILSWLTQYIVF